MIQIECKKCAQRRQESLGTPIPVIRSERQNADRILERETAISSFETGALEETLLLAFMSEGHFSSVLRRLEEDPTVPPFFASTKPNVVARATTTWRHPIPPSPRDAPPLRSRGAVSMLLTADEGGADGSATEAPNREEAAARMEPNTTTTTNTTYIAAHTQSPPGDDENDDVTVHSTTVVGEEEATPAQTAWGKQLLFARVAPDRKDHDVLSITSEHGSLLEEEEEEDNEPVEEDEQGIEHSLPSDRGILTAPSESTVFQTPPQEDDEEEEGLEVTLQWNDKEKPSSSTLIPTPDAAAAETREPKGGHPPSSRPSLRNLFVASAPTTPVTRLDDDDDAFLGSFSRRQWPARDDVLEEFGPFSWRSPASRPAGPPNPLHYAARSCFSWDDTATTTYINDDHCEWTMPPVSKWKLPGPTPVPELSQPELQHPRIPNAKSWDATSAFRSPPSAPWASWNTHRIRLSSSLSPSRGQPDQVQSLKSPQRIEIERDDAIDILACLVERGVSWKPEENIDTIVAEEEEEVAPSAPGEIAAVVQELQELSLAEERLGDFYQSQPTEAHHKRAAALKELVRSHEYALEMQRASQSASSWLQSIGRLASSSAMSSPSQASPSRAGNVVLRSSEPTTPTARSSDGSTATTPRMQQAAGEESSAASETMDLLTAKAMWHASQMELREKSDWAARLNEELAQCRAEIGRLKSAAQSVTSFRSPNRSMFDEFDDVPEEEEGDNDNPPLLDNNRILDESDCLNSSFMREEGVGTGESSADVEQYKAALNQANAVIRQLHSSLQKYSKELEGESAPVVDLTLTVPAASSNDTSPGLNPDVEDDAAGALPDGENFVTDWDVLTLPWTSPPDHEVRSPIVDAVLELWTNDRTLQESLRGWMDQVLVEGADPESIPPLTVNHLDHRARDAFCLHIFPLLLRRPDILLDMKTRVHRRTTYDLAVSVDRAVYPLPHSPPPYISHSQRQFETTSIRSDVGSYGTDSSMTTAVMSNTARALLNMNTLDDERNVYSQQLPPMSRLSYDEMTEDMASSSSASGALNPGFMSTLGGALGGLLGTRRRTEHETPSRGTATPLPSNMPTIAESPSSMSSKPFLHSLVEVENDMDQPYHRVVSAPAGRIGVTFVEYRGHCMVSDVYPDSPLIGWIFPSDVLIAIDDTAVSGMRIRDIIQILKDRVGSPRALRVMSSHAMNEFASLNASAVMNDETGS
jgi:hypothetical protein